MTLARVQALQLEVQHLSERYEQQTRTLQGLRTDIAQLPTAARIERRITSVEKNLHRRSYKWFSLFGIALLVAVAAFSVGYVHNQSAAYQNCVTGNNATTQLRRLLIRSNQQSDQQFQQLTKNATPEFRQALEESQKANKQFIADSLKDLKVTDCKQHKLFGGV